MKMFMARLWFMSALLALFGAAVIWRLFTIQVVQGEHYASRSKAQSQQRIVLKASRGTIYDRNGRELARSVERSVAVSPSNEQRSAKTKLTRLYPQGELAAPVLGWVGHDGDGQGGIELACDRWLRGEDGWAVQQRDARATAGRSRYRTVTLPQQAPRQGSGVYLTIDMSIQRIVEQVIGRTGHSLGAKSAMAMVMDPRSGKVLAMASWPSFDPNFASRYPLEQRINPCIARNYEPGSTFKLVTAAAALEQRLFNENDSLSGNNGRYEIYDQVIRDHEPYGMITFADAVAYSSNVCFARIADKLGSTNLYNTTRDCGFGAPTRIALPGEESGTVHAVAGWSGRTRVTMAMGHELTATLLQMMTLYGAVANDGVLLQPRIIERIENENGTVLDSSSMAQVRRVVDPSVALRLRNLLGEVVERGTGKRAAVAGVTVAGKTGTSQIFDRETGSYSDRRYHASFIGFAPVDDPVLLCGVVVSEPAAGEAGGMAAAPAFRAILEQIIAHPQLEYASALLRRDTQSVDSVAPAAAIVVPQVCGLNTRDALRLLKIAGLGGDLSGAGEKVVEQTPSAGERVAVGSDVVLLAQGASDADTLLRSIPDCRGRDARDAVTLLAGRGLVPVVVGAGFVNKQFPSVGTVVKAAAACSLFCSFEG